jgi:hypothetical protein
MSALPTGAPPSARGAPLYWPADPDSEGQMAF